MKKIYIDTDFKCHVADNGSMTAIETAFFDEPLQHDRSVLIGSYVEVA